MYNKLFFGVAAALLSSGYTHAKQSGQASLEKVERIEVTGSRIKGVDLEGTQPVTIISSEDIGRSGATSVIELLQDLPQLKDI